MSRIVAIDPDTKKCGVAVFQESRLQVAFAAPLDHHWKEDTVLNVIWSEMNPFMRASQVVCEMPQQYGRVGDQRDFLAVARVVGRIEQMCVERGISFEAVAPHKWKGQTPKDVSTRRTWKNIDLAERTRVVVPLAARRILERGGGVKKGEGSDVLDAIGIGLWATGR